MVAVLYTCAHIYEVYAYIYVHNDTFTIDCLFFKLNISFSTEKETSHGFWTYIKSQINVNKK